MPYTPDTFTNYAVSSVAGGAAGRGTPLQAADTTCYVPIGDGAKFPTVGPFNIVLGTTEIAKCTARAGDVLTLLRGQEGTTAGTYAVSTSLQLVVSALNLTDVWTAINQGRDYIVEDYGAIADGVTDNTTAIQAAINAANAAGGGRVRFGVAGTYLTGTLTIYSNIHLVGLGAAATTLRLKSGANADLIWGGATNAGLINVTNITQGNGSNGGLGAWSIRDMALGGNRGGQSDTVANPTVAATTSGAATTGGFLKASTSYTFAYTYTSAASGPYGSPGETKQVSATTAYTPPAGTNTNQITLTAPTLPAGATGTRWYLVATGDGAAVVGFIGSSATNALAITQNMASNTATAMPPFSNTTTQSYCLRVYGYLFELSNVEIKNGYSGGALLDWNGNALLTGGTSPLIANCLIHDNNGMGLTYGGPHDAQMAHTIINTSGQHNLYLGPHAEGMGWTDCHCWGATAGMVQVLCEANGCSFVGGEIEGSPVVQLVILANYVDVHGAQLFGVDASPSTAIQFGQQAGLTPYANSAFQSSGLTTLTDAQGCDIDVTITHCSGTNGALWFSNEFGGDNVRAMIWLPGAGVAFTGTLAAATNLDLMVFGVSGQYSIRINGGYTVYGGGNAVAVPATNGTINTAGETLIRVNPAAAITGVILQAGTYDGQMAIVYNKSAFSITFAIAGTSHVADGASDVIAANTSHGFVWDATAALWSHMA